MLSRADRAARICLFSSVFWLLVGSSALLVAATKLIGPDVLSGAHLSFGRLTAAASITLQYGWVGLGGMCAAFYVLPRITGTPLRWEAAGIAAAWIFNIALVLGVTANMTSGPQGPMFLELPVALTVLVILGAVMVAAAVLGTIASSSEPTLYASGWYIAGAAVWAPLALIAGRVAPMKGPDAWVQGSFGVSSVFNLWFAGMGIAALYYVLPRASGAPLYSHRLAMIGFWSLAFTGPLSSQARHVFGPSPIWLQSLAIAASIGLLIPVLTVLVNTFGTLRGFWDRVPSRPSLRFMVAGTLFWSGATIQGSLQSMRSVARAVGTTEWITGQVWLLLLGGLTFWIAGLITYAMPRMMGRRWLQGSWVSAHFWLAAMGVALISGAALAAGAFTAAVWTAGVANQIPLSFGGGYSVVLSSVSLARVVAWTGTGLFLVGQLIFALNLFRSISAGELRPVEIVLPMEAL